jgi:hypothetical protein
MKSQIPALASAASWMEATGLSVYELRLRFTKSEQVIAGWRSSELAANMAVGRTEAPRQLQPGYHSGEGGGLSEAQLDLLESKIGSFADKMVDERGEIDLRRLTGDEAMR